jgi:hypothetical protein
MVIWGERISPCFQTANQEKAGSNLKRRRRISSGGYKNVMLGGNLGLTRFENVEDLGNSQDTLNTLIR